VRHHAFAGVVPRAAVALLAVIAGCGVYLLARGSFSSAVQSSLEDSVRSEPLAILPREAPRALRIECAEIRTVLGRLQKPTVRR